MGGGGLKSSALHNSQGFVNNIVNSSVLVAVEARPREDKYKIPINYFGAHNELGRINGFELFTMLPTNHLHGCVKRCTLIEWTSPSNPDFSHYEKTIEKCMS
jgi:hypothetical protein